jgi:hypothetical protein
MQWIIQWKKKILWEMKYQYVQLAKDHGEKAK